MREPAIQTTFRLPKGILKRLDEQAERMYTNRTALVIQLVNSGLKTIELGLNDKLSEVTKVTNEGLQ